VTICASCGTGNPDAAKFCSECGARLRPGAPARGQRKTVTVLFCDVVGSTALGDGADPEALQAVLGRYFERMKTVVERHGGAVEKFIGDAVVAVFGVPVVHEDDALRACRAALEMRAALPALGLRGRIGVNSGEVVTGSPERLATGDAVNVAARLEQAAEPGQVLIGAATRALVRDAVETGEERPLDVKGKAAPLAAYSLLAVVGDATIARHLDAPIVGRALEQRALAEAWQRAQSERACHLFTILGTAGVGKSRLSAEFLSSLGGTRAVSGRCLSYGEGITYWPVVEAVIQLGARPSDARAAAALAALLRESEAPVAAEEIAWAFRKLLEEAAPVVCVFDDLHWAEPTLLDLVDHVADWSRGAPILLLCMARPELLERRPAWGGGKLNATTVMLEPLDDDETGSLIDQLAGAGSLDARLRGRILDAAGGNPLFVEEMLAMVGESGSEEVIVPPTIHALLAARLDQLETSERRVLERGSVEGNIFHLGGVQALSGAEPDVQRRLMGLVSKELVRPDRAQIPGDEAFRFRHLLIRDAAYDGLPKATRAELHERFADWLEAHAHDLVELDEICGYHLEQAHRYRCELGLDDDGLDDERTARLARRASDRLGAAGTRAFDRSDVGAARVLLERALALLPAAERPFELELNLVEARFTAGELQGAIDAAVALAERNERRGEEVTALRARLHAVQYGMLAGGSASGIRDMAERALAVFEQACDDAGLADAYSALAWAEHNACHWARQNEAIERMVEHATRAGYVALARRALDVIGTGYVFGPTPVGESLEWFEQHAADMPRRPHMLGQKAMLAAMQGDFDHARLLCEESEAQLLELGQRLIALTSAMGSSYVELLAGNASRAAEVAVAGCDALAKHGERGWLSTLACQAAGALYVLGDDDEAWRWTEVAAEAGAADDVITQMLLRQVRAKVLARRGVLREAEVLAREAVAICADTDMVAWMADARLDLAEVLAAAGHTAEAAAEARTAEELYRAKGHVVGVALARTKAGELAAAAT